MIEELSLRDLKCFASARLPFRPLTVLTGINGTGKSTVVQALLLARQASMLPDSSVVELNGPYLLALGEAIDVLRHDAEGTTIGIDLWVAGQSYRFTFAVPDDRALNLAIRDRPDTVPAVLTGQGTAFTYLNAERLGPRDQLDVTAEDIAHLGVGVRGQYTAQALALRETAEVREPLRHPRTHEHGVTTLRTQVEMWASDIIRPIRINAQWPAGINASLIRFQEPGRLGEPVRPTNMGFGFSFALPIVVAGLLAPAGGLLVVENPEAHLHPAGQSRLGRFLARVAGSGTQVVVETHSDHVINGIRLASVEDRTLPTESAVIHFFDGDGSSALIELTRRGGLSQWPAGFFDQIETDLGGIARAKRRID
jgi:predicted ATPase